MKKMGESMRRRWKLPTAGAASAVAMAMGGWAADTPASVPESVDACRHNLQLIHDALGTYRRMNDKWPARLSDLAGLYVAPEDLICPVCAEREVFRVRDPGLFNRVEKDPQTTYKWELNPEQEVRGYKVLDWKEKQRLTAVGEAVPVVRCDQHAIGGEKVHLNLSFGGDVYVSGVYWEELFVDLLALPYLQTPNQVFVEQSRIPERVPPRPVGATPRHLDLGPVATALPSDPWQDGTSSDTLAALVAAVGNNGLWVHGGIAFDVRALVQLDGRRLRPNEKAPGQHERFYPTQPVTIPVGQPGRRLHVLGGAIFRAPVGAEIGGLSVAYVGGSVQRIPWRYGIDLRDGWSDPKVGEEAGHLAWTADGFTPNVAGVPQRSGPLKVYHWVIELERPGAIIESLTFFSSATHPEPTERHLSGPFLLAATLE